MNVEKMGTDKWREDKVAFVSGHTGGPFWEVVLVFALVPALACLLAHLVRAAIVAARRGREQPLLLATFVEWACTFVPMLLSMTLCADALVPLTLALLAVDISLALIVSRLHVVCVSSFHNSEHPPFFHNSLTHWHANTTHSLLGKKTHTHTHTHTHTPKQNTLKTDILCAGD